MGNPRSMSLNKPEGMRARVRDHHIISPAITCISLWNEKNHSA